MERFNTKNALYPLLGFVISIVTLVYGLIMARHDNIFYFYACVWVLFVAFGYIRSCLAVIPVALLMCLTFGGITYAISGNVENTVVALSRSIAIVLAFIPGLAVSSTLFIRNLQQFKVPKVIVLGMMVALNFFPILSKEIKQIKQAMRTRGVTTIANPKVFYRALLMPLMSRIVNISDTLALSVETRGFTTDKSSVTIYNPVKIDLRDVAFVIIFATLAVLTAVL